MTYSNEENEANRLLNPLEATSQTGETTATETSETSTQEPAPFEESENEESASGDRNLGNVDAREKGRRTDVTLYRACVVDVRVFRHGRV